MTQRDKPERLRGWSLKVSLLGDLCETSGCRPHMTSSLWFRASSYLKVDIEKAVSGSVQTHPGTRPGEAARECVCWQAGVCVCVCTKTLMSLLSA